MLVCWREIQILTVIVGFHTIYSAPVVRGRAHSIICNHLPAAGAHQAVVGVLLQAPDDVCMPVRDIRAELTDL